MWATICQARYSGTYEGGRWLAFSATPDELPDNWNAGDTDAMLFFQTEAQLVGRGPTPAAALADLQMRLGLPLADVGRDEQSGEAPWPTTLVGWRTDATSTNSAENWVAVKLQPHQMRFGFDGHRPLVTRLQTDEAVDEGRGSGPAEALAAMLRTQTQTGSSPQQGGLHPMDD